MSSGKTDVIKLGFENLPSLDPFDELDPMMNEVDNDAESNVLRMNAIACLLIEMLGSKNESEKNNEKEEEESEWVAPHSEL